jgi:hypothetical protein
MLRSSVGCEAKKAWTGRRRRRRDWNSKSSDGSYGITAGIGTAGRGDDRGSTKCPAATFARNDRASRALKLMQPD